MLFLNDIDFWSIHFTCGPRGGLVQGWESTWHFSWPCATSLDAWAMSLEPWACLMCLWTTIMIHELNSFYSRSYKVLRVSKLHTSNKIATKNKEMGKPTCPAFSRSEFLCFHLAPHDMFTNYFRSDDCASMWLQRSVDGDSWILWNQWTRINVPECNAIRCLSLMLQCSLPPMAQGC